jgi:hypothetical protein
MVSAAAKEHRQREARVTHGRQQKPEHGIFSKYWAQWAGSLLLVELEGERPFTAKLFNVNRTAGTATLHETHHKTGELLGVRTIDWPPDGKVTVKRTPSGIGQHQSTGARGHLSV